MKDQLISFDTAKLAKEKGFNWECLWVYGFGMNKPRKWARNAPIECISADWNNIHNGNYTEVDKERMCSAPTQSLLQKFLLEKMTLWVHPHPLSSSGGWSFSILKYKDGKITNEINNGGSSTSLSFPEAKEEMLQEALKLLGEKEA